MRKFKSFWDTVTMLKEELPTQYPLSVRRVSMPNGTYGDCNLKKRMYRIRIERKVPEWCAMEILLHEYSHALSWEQDQDWHGENWGIAYSKVYRKLLEHWDVVINRNQAAKISYFNS